jgi:hypothetical protein
VVRGEGRGGSLYRHKCCIKSKARRAQRARQLLFRQVARAFKSDAPHTIESRLYFTAASMACAAESRGKS